MLQVTVVAWPSDTVFQGHDPRNRTTTSPNYIGAYPIVKELSDVFSEMEELWCMVVGCLGWLPSVA